MVCGIGFPNVSCKPLQATCYMEVSQVMGLPQIIISQAINHPNHQTSWHTMTSYRKAPIPFRSPGMTSPCDINPWDSLTAPLQRGTICRSAGLPCWAQTSGVARVRSVPWVPSVAKRSQVKLYGYSSEKWGLFPTNPTSFCSCPMSASFFPCESGIPCGLSAFFHWIWPWVGLSHAITIFRHAHMCYRC